MRHKLLTNFKRVLANMAFVPVKCKCSNTETAHDQFLGRAGRKAVSRPVVNLHHSKPVFRCPTARNSTSKGLETPSRRSLTVCAAATLTEMTSVSGQMAKLKEQKRLACPPVQNNLHF